MNQLTTLQNLTPVEIFSQAKVDSILNKISEEAKENPDRLLDWDVVSKNL